MRSSILLSVLLFLVSCSGMNSELDTVFVPDKDISEKPRCQFKPTNNCWTKSVALLSSCMEPENPEDIDVFVENKRFCSNKSSKLVEFPNPLQFQDENSMEFRLINLVKGNTCFHYKQNGSSFTVDENEFGKLHVKTLDNGDIHVQCFFDEEFIVPAEAVEKGCQGASLKVGEYIPKAFVRSFHESEDSGYEFMFQGLGGSPRPVFKCYQ